MALGTARASPAAGAGEVGVVDGAEVAEQLPALLADVDEAEDAAGGEAEEGAAGVAAGLVAEGVAGSASSTGEGVAEGAALEAGEGVAEAAGLEGVEGALPPVEAPSQTLGPGTVYSVAPP